MDTHKKYYSPRQNVMKFVDWDIEEYNPNWNMVKLMDELEKHPLTISSELAKYIPARDGDMISKYLGWRFNYAPYMKKFVGKITVYDEDWSETKIHEFYGLSENDVRNWISENGITGYEDAEICWLIPEPEYEY